MASIHFIYGTTSGNTEMVVDQAAGFLKSKGHKATASRVELSGPGDMLKPEMLVLASSTYGHGLLQEDMADFLGRAETKALELKGKPCAVIGLGDPKYEREYHIEAAPLLEKFLDGHGGKRLVPSLKISRSPVLQLDLRIREWAEELAKKLPNL